MNNLKNDAITSKKILSDLQFIVEHTEGVTMRPLGEKEVLFGSVSFHLSRIRRMIHPKEPTIQGVAPKVIKDIVRCTT